MHCPIMSVIFGKVLYLIPQKMTSQKMQEDQRIPCLHKIEGLSDSRKPLSPTCLPMAEQPSLEKEKAVKEETFNRLSVKQV